MLKSLDLLLSVSLGMIETIFLQHLKYFIVETLQRKNLLSFSSLKRMTIQRRSKYIYFKSKEN